MSKFKLFVENFLVYGLGGILNRIVPFLMLPIITRLMPNTKYFGLNDLSNTIVQFGTAIAIMGMYDAVFRLFFDKDDFTYQRKICSTALIFVFGIGTIISLILYLFDLQVTLWIFESEEYKILLHLTCISIFVGATNSIIALPTRVQNKRKVFISIGLVSSILSYSISVPLLLMGEFLIALPLAGIITALITEISFYIINRKWFSYRLFDIQILKNLLRIALPLLPTFLIYWIFTSSDRLIIAKLLNNEAVGLYAVGAKIASASQLIYTAFAGGWQYFAFSTMREENQVKNNSLVFEYLGIISFISGLFACAWSKSFFEIFFTGDYVNGYIVMPYLFLGPLLLMLYQVIGNQFLVIKKTWPGMLILSFGAILNLLLNFCLIPVFGIEGAAIATLIGYAVSVIICGFVLKKMSLVDIERRFIYLSLLMLFFMFLWRVYFINYLLISTTMAIIFAICCALFYKIEILKLCRSIW